MNISKKYNAELKSWVVCAETFDIFKRWWGSSKYEQTHRFVAVRSKKKDLGTAEELVSKEIETWAYSNPSGWAVRWQFGPVKIKWKCYYKNREDLP